MVVATRKLCQLVLQRQEALQLQPDLEGSRVGSAAGLEVVVAVEAADLEEASAGATGEGSAVGEEESAIKVAADLVAEEVGLVVHLMDLVMVQFLPLMPRPALAETEEGLDLVGMVAPPLMGA